MERLDLSHLSVRELNQYLHHELPRNGIHELEIINPNGLHSIAVGADSASENQSLRARRLFLGGDEPTGRHHGAGQRRVERG